MSTKTNSILIAFPVDHASLGKLWFVVLSKSNFELCLVDKLRTDKENLITLYLDDNLKTRLMTHVLEDLQTLAGNDISKTSSQVRSAHFGRLAHANRSALLSVYVHCLHNIMTSFISNNFILTVFKCYRMSLFANPQSPVCCVIYDQPRTTTTTPFLFVGLNLCF